MFWTFCRPDGADMCHSSKATAVITPIVILPFVHCDDFVPLDSGTYAVARPRKGVESLKCEFEIPNIKDGGMVIGPRNGYRSDYKNGDTFIILCTRDIKELKDEG